MKTPLLVEKHFKNNDFSTKTPVFVEKFFKAGGLSVKMPLPMEKRTRAAVVHTGYQQVKVLKNRIFVDK